MGTGEGADLDLLEASLNQHRSQQQFEGSGGNYMEIREARWSGPTGGVSAVFTEFPSNPLLKCPNLHRSLPHPPPFSLLISPFSLNNSIQLLSALLLINTLSHSPFLFLDSLL